MIGLVALVFASPLAEASEALAAGRLAEAAALTVRAGDEGAAWKLLDDEARLLRCFELQAATASVGAKLESELDGARRLLRLEAERLRRHLYDGAHAQTQLPLLVAAAPRLQYRIAEPEPVVRWPLEAEIWPGERLEPVLGPHRCFDRGDAASRAPRFQRQRLRDEHRALAAAVEHIERLPPSGRSRVAAAYLDLAEQNELEVPEAWLERLRSALGSDLADIYAQRARLALARRGKPSPEHRAELERLAEDDRMPPALRAAARVAWVQQAEEPAERARAAKVEADPEALETASELRAWLDLARASALVDLALAPGAPRAAVEAVERFAADFGRRRRPGPLDARTVDVLLDAQLGRDSGHALEVATTLGSARPAAVRARWYALAQRAMEVGLSEQARDVLDRLWSELRLDTRPLEEGPLDTADVLAARARWELLYGALSGFSGMMKLLARLGEVPRHRAATRAALRTLAQEAVADLARADPKTRRGFARGLLDAWKRLADPASQALGDAALLEAWARARPEPRHPSRQEAVEPPVALGRVIVSRRPLTLPAPPAIALPPLVVDSFFAWLDGEGEVRVGLPPEIVRLAQSLPEL